MKKILLAVLLLALPAAAQQVDSSQVKLKTNGGLTGDTTNSLAVGVYRGTSSPSSPVTGQLWCDTTLSPCTLKQYTGSTWSAPQVNAAITTQTDVSSFPGSPVDGQIFFSKAEKLLWVYNSTTSLWYAIGTSYTTSGANIQDVYTGTLVSAPGAATATASGTAGSLSAGTYSYKITCRTASGGETTGGTVSNTITSLVSKSVDLSAIPTCSGGTTTNRNIYRTKVNQAATGPWYWVQNIADNTTTTGINDGLADASALLLAPDINFSAPLPGAWATINNSTSTVTGGCGSTGASRNSMACFGGTPGLVLPSAITSDAAMVRASLDISAYSTGNYTIQFRVKQVSLNGDTYTTIKAPSLFGMRTGTADNAIRFLVTGSSAINSGGCGSVAATWPLSGSVHTENCFYGRTSVGGSATNYLGVSNPFPQADALPIYFRVVRKNGYLNSYVSSDAVTWSVMALCTGATNTTTACSYGATYSASSVDHFEFPLACGNNTAQTNAGWLEIDSFTLTVN